MVNLAQWHGYAKHPDLPGIVIVCGIDRSNEPIYRNPDWTAKFAPNGNGFFYHMEEEGHYHTMGNGASWNGDLSDEARKSLAQHADFMHRRATALVTAKRRKAEKAAKKDSGRAAQTAGGREEGRPRRSGSRTAKAARRPRPPAPASDSSSRQRPGRRRPQERPALPKGKKPGDEPRRSDRARPQAAEPLIADPTPVVIDALVANLLNRPTWLPPETDFAAIAADKIAELLRL